MLNSQTNYTPPFRAPTVLLIGWDYLWLCASHVCLLFTEPGLCTSTREGFLAQLTEGTARGLKGQLED